MLLFSGRLPRADGEVLLEKHLAEHHHLKAGDALTVQVPGLERSLSVTGGAVSAEYLWVTRDAQDVFPSPATFGVGGCRGQRCRRWRRPCWRLRLTPWSPRRASSWRRATRPAISSCWNRLGAADGAIVGELEKTLGPEQVLSATPQENLAGVRLLQMDVDGYKGMAAFFPFFFLGVGAFILASVLGRLVDAQRPVIGTLLALGVGQGKVLRHYLAYALILGVAGALLGATLGLVAGRAVTYEYATELGIPFVTARLHWDLALWGLLGGAGVALLSGAAPAWRASRLAPAESMRPPRPSLGALARLARRLPAPLSIRLAVRGVLGAPLRSVGTIFGIAAALVLVIVSGVLLDSMRTVVNVLFHDAQRYDLRVDFMAPEPLARLQDELGKVDGVTKLEGLVALPVRLTANGREESAALQGLSDDGALLRSMDADGTLVPPRVHGVVLTRHVAKQLGLKVGDAVEVRAIPAGGVTTLAVSGFADAVMGSVASARQAEVQAAFGLGASVTAAVLSVRPERLAQARRDLAGMPTVARVEDLAAMRGVIGQVMGLGWVMLGTMLLFSAVLAAAILFNTATLNILERRRELATLRSLGRSQAELALGLTLEHGLLTLGGLAVGIPLAIVASSQVLALYSGPLFALPFVLSPQTLGAAVLGVALTLLLAQWPALRAAGRLPLAEAVRTRE